jgi:hypothetical protein
MSARKRKRGLTKGCNAPIAWCVLDNLIKAYMKGAGDGLS